MFTSSKNLKTFRRFIPTNSSESEVYLPLVLFTTLLSRSKLIITSSTLRPSVYVNSGEMPIIASFLIALEYPLSCATKLFSATPAATISTDTLNGFSALFIADKLSESASICCENVRSASGIPSVKALFGSRPSFTSSPSEIESSSVSYLRGSVPMFLTSS